jgi:serine/threonine protein kinase
MSSDDDHVLDAAQVGCDMDDCQEITANHRLRVMNIGKQTCTGWTWPTSSGWLAGSPAPPPYAAQVYAFGAADGGRLLWIAMERVQGVSLGDWLEKHGRMPLERFVPFFDHVCEVVHAAHERGIVHRDLKPSNIMVVEGGDRLTPKLLDLGSARGSWRRGSELAPAAAADAPGEHRDAEGSADVDRADGDHSRSTRARTQVRIRETLDTPIRHLEHERR